MTSVTMPSEESVRLDPQAVADLATKLRGELIRPGDRATEDMERVDRPVSGAHRPVRRSSGCDRRRAVRQE
jgi:hypothetical protein